MKLLELISRNDSGKLGLNVNDPNRAVSEQNALMMGQAISEFLRINGDQSFYLLKWNDLEGKSVEDIVFPELPNIISELILEKREAYMLRSMYSCRFLSFGYDRQIHFCVKSEDKLSNFDSKEIEISDVSPLMIETDFFDGI